MRYEDFHFDFKKFSFSTLVSIKKSKNILHISKTTLFYYKMIRVDKTVKKANVYSLSDKNNYEA